MHSIGTIEISFFNKFSIYKSGYLCNYFTLFYINYALF